MFLTLHLSWWGLQFSWCNLQARHACQKTQASTQIYVYPIPLETLVWGPWGFPPSPSMFANERNTCSIIIYRIICLFIILFFQKENVDSGPLYLILHLDLGGRAACYNTLRGFWKMSMVMWSWHFYDCEQVLKTSRASYHHYPSLLVGRPQTWSTRVLRSQEGMECGAVPLPVHQKKKQKKNTDSFCRACITRYIQDILHTNALPDI